MTLLEIRGLVTEFETRRGPLRAVDGLDLIVASGQRFGIVGESGSGKTVSMLSALRLLERPGYVAEGSVHVNGVDMLRAGSREVRRVLGGTVGMVFQDALSALNPVVTIGTQLVETVRAHDRSVSRRQALIRAGDLLERVGIPDPHRRLREYAHELSGGMRQRVVIAMAIANRPRLIVADEPTTALDVTVQAQVLDLLRELTQDSRTSLVIITHDLGVVAEIADSVAVMYAGRIVEQGSVSDIFHNPRHPYTCGLLESRPTLSRGAEELRSIPGQPPSLVDLPSGCSYRPRCPRHAGRSVCADERPPLSKTGVGQWAACHFALEPERISTSSPNGGGGTSSAGDTGSSR